ncbi:dihydroorotase [Geothrix sp. PMB-07]|uniref:dihydroorotase n=1 Tax=Geothrix sp. PMB-07 TaxID=3068640 RepID=UPI00274067B5|nr:dihydroorotase [Geothrix sp. PMB-07]WLT30143.1 dihydroorotase [Geothrix sp. PMB-07]
MSFLVKNVRLIDPAQGFDGPGALLVSEGQVVAAGVEATNHPQAAGAEVVDGGGAVLAPGFVDLHVHFREPGQTRKESIESGSRAAIAGGFTAVCAMANTKPVNDSVAITEMMLTRAAKAELCRYFPIGTVSREMKGEELADMGTLKAAGCVAFSDDGLPISNASLMRRALEYTRWLDVPVVAHEEDKDLAGKGYMHEGAVSASLGCLGIPAAAEEAMVARDIILAEHTGGHLHLAHLSTKGSMRMVREAKARGLNVTCEVTPHHFALSDKELMKFDSDYKMNPPLRTEADIQAVLEAIADGTVDAIATDHAPHGWDDKEVELPIAAFGVIGLETALPLTLELLVNRGVISLSKAISLLAWEPAKVFHLDRQGLGSLKPGAPADFVLFDPTAKVQVDRAFIQSKSYNTPFKGWSLPGKVLSTWVAGKRVWG